jgi:hypothetical protein
MRADGEFVSHSLTLLVAGRRLFSGATLRCMAGRPPNGTSARLTGQEILPRDQRRPASSEAPLCKLEWATQTNTPDCGNPLGSMADALLCPIGSALSFGLSVCLSLIARSGGAKISSSDGRRNKYERARVLRAVPLRRRAPLAQDARRQANRPAAAPQRESPHNDDDQARSAIFIGLLRARLPSSKLNNRFVWSRFRFGVDFVLVVTSTHRQRVQANDIIRRPPAQMAACALPSAQVVRQKRDATLRHSSLVSRWPAPPGRPRFAIRARARPLSAA